MSGLGYASTGKTGLTSWWITLTTRQFDQCGELAGFLLSPLVGESQREGAGDRACAVTHPLPHP
ncbi:MAG: hypothetical protein ACREQ3_25580, partial [Candidatus Binatia bacterium]